MPQVSTRPVDWLRAGVALFARKGLEGLKVEALSHVMESGTAEFYIHFMDEEAFFEQMLKHWRQAKTTRPIEAFTKLPVEHRLEKLVDIVFADRDLHDFLFYLREIAQENKKIGALLKEIEEERIESTLHIFKGMGFGLKEINLKGEILYSFYLGWYERHKHKKFTPALRSQVLEQIVHMLGIGN
jgi:AcrR family transcriptional regulator